LAAKEQTKSFEIKAL